MPVELVRLELRLRRRMLLGTGFGAMAYLLLIVLMYPSFRGDTSLNSMLSSNPGAAAAFGITGSITSPAGWLNGNMYANFGPLLALLLSIGYGAAAIAGQAADGTLGLVATLPLGRTRIAAAKLLALVLVAAVVPIASYLPCLLGPHFQLYPNWSALAWTSVALGLLAFDLGALALWLGAVTGSRGLALGVSAAAAAAAYLLSSLAPLVHALRGPRRLSPFYWAVGNDQLARGVPPAALVALAGLGMVLAGAAVPAFRRLDLQ